MSDTAEPNGNLVKVLKPKFLSLVSVPANQRPISIVRSAPPKGEIAMNKPVTRITRSQTANPVVKLTFPATMSDDEVAAAMMTYGMKGFAIERVGEVITATRSDLQSIANDKAVMDINLGGGIVATVQRSSIEGASTPGKSAIAVCGFEFDATKFADVQSVSAWIERNSVDKASEPTQNSASSFVVTRGAVEDGADTRRLQIEEGVVAVIKRDFVLDVPGAMVAIVADAAYGNWGWGFVDFAAAVADVQFSEWMEVGIEKLYDVLWRILFYSDLPMADRKDLVNTALGQFGAFVASAMDALPRQVAISVVRSAQPKENPMSKQDTTQGGAASAGATTQPAAATTTATTQPAAAAATDESSAKPVTRGELKDLLRGAMKEIADEDKAAADEAAKAQEAASQQITRGDLKAVVEEVVKPLADKVQKLEGATILRSDTGDTATTTQQQSEAKSGDKKDIFRGALGLPSVGRRKAG